MFPEILTKNRTHVLFFFLKFKVGNALKNTLCIKFLLIFRREIEKDLEVQHAHFSFIACMFSALIKKSVANNRLLLVWL